MSRFIASSRARLLSAAYTVAYGLLFVALSGCSYDAGPYGSGDPPITHRSRSVSYCAWGTPLWIAFQDGDADWRLARAVRFGDSTRYEGDFTSDRIGVATGRVFPSGLGSLVVQYVTATELSDIGDAQGGCKASPAREWRGSVTGLAANEMAIVGSGNSSREVVSPFTDPSFKLSFVESGPQSILAERLAEVSGRATLTGFILRHGIDLADGDTIPALDFTSNEVVQPVSAEVRLSGLDGGAAVTNLEFRAAGTFRSVGVSGATTDTGTVRNMRALPASSLEANDVQFISVTTPPAPYSNVVRSSVVYFHDPVNRDIALAPAPTSPAITVVANSPAALLSARFTADDNYDQLAAINFQQGSTVVSLSMTRAYADRSANGYLLSAPDLSGVLGFDSRWELAAGTQTIWTSTRIGGTVPLRLDAFPAAGMTRRLATDAGFITP